MHELTTNLEPGNPDGHTVLRYLVEAKQMPLDVAIERVYKAVGKYAADYRSDQNKLLTGMVVSGVLGLPVFFPFGVPSLLIAGAIGASAVSWQELGAMRDRLKPEYVCLKKSVLLEQFIKWLAEEVKKRRGQAFDSPTTPFQADVITIANILSAYEHTVFSVAQGEHLENSASDPILALFVAKLRQSTNHLPSWIMDAFRHLEQAEAQRSAHLDAAYGYMFGNLSQSQVGQDTRLGAVEVPVQTVEGEQRLGKSIQISHPQLPPATAPLRERELPGFDRDRIINESKGLMIIGDMGAAKTCVAQYIANGFEGHGIIIFDPHGKTDWGNAYVITKMGAIYEQMRILLELLENGDESPLLVIADEWLEIRGDRRNKAGDYKGLADDFIRLFSTKPRKFNKLAAFVLHSPNVEAAGVDSFLRENYLKIHLGRLAKKALSSLLDCAYPCVLEDEQQEHPTHGHHTAFLPKGKAPRNLQPLQSAAINIPLAYMKGSEVEVCDRGWSNGQLNVRVDDLRYRLEFLLNADGIDSSIDTEADKRSGSGGDTSDTKGDTTDTRIDTSDTVLPETPANTGDTSDTKGDTDDTKIEVDKADSSIGDTDDTGIDTKQYTPANLSKEQVMVLINHLKKKGMSQTQVIEDVWCCEKNKAGWKQAYTEYKELIGE